MGRSDEGTGATRWVCEEIRLGVGDAESRGS